MHLIETDAMLEYIAYAALAFFFYQWLKQKFKSKPRANPKPTANPSHQRQPNKPVQASLIIDYIDAANQSTTRTVKITSFQAGNPAGIRGFCLLRKETRIFRIDRVQKAVDSETGEIIENLIPWLESRRTAT